MTRRSVTEESEIGHGSNPVKQLMVRCRTYILSNSVFNQDTDSTGLFLMSPSSMLKKIIVTGMVLLGCLLLMLGAAFWFREPVGRETANYFLADREITVTKVQGMQLTARHVLFDELEFMLPSGQLLGVSTLEVNFSFTSLQSAPVIESVAIGSAQLQHAPAAIESNVLSEQISSVPESAAMKLSELLLLLREFPIANIDIQTLSIPQWPEALSINLQHSTGDLSLKLYSGAMSLLAHFTQAHPTDTGLLQASLSRSDETVGSFQLTLTPKQSLYDLTGTAHLDIPDLNALLSELQQKSNLLPLANISLNGDLSGSVADDFLGTNSATALETFVLGINAGSTLTLSTEVDGVLIELLPVLTDRAELRIATGAGLTISSGSLPLSVTGKWREENFNVTSLFTFTECQLFINAACDFGFNGKASFADYSLAGTMAVSASGIGSGNDEYGLNTTGLELEGLPFWLPAFDTTAKINLNQKSLAFSSSVLLRNATADAGITAKGSYDNSSGVASMNLTVPQLEFKEMETPLSAWLGDWPYPVDLLGGSLAAELALQWQPGIDKGSAGVLTANVKSTMKDVAGYYNDIFFSGLNGELEATVDSRNEFAVETPPLEFTAAEIEIGVPLNNVALAFRFDSLNRQLVVSNFYTEAFDGTVTASDVEYNFTQERNKVELFFSGLQLERILELVKYEGVEAFGAVSGELPMTLTANGVEMEAGTLHADEPGGSIRYLDGAKAGIQGNAGLDLVNQALGNYQFQSLTSQIDYSPQGELLFAMQLQGYSPDVSNDQRINLNLNISDNIPDLLDSLKAARVIEDFLELHYK